jgi:sugar O-acyltransferase (sialic acid O-acetyltransferase NeuD family)
LGSGHLGNQIVSLSEEIKSHQIVGYYDDFQEKNTTVKGVPIVGKSKDIIHDYQQGKFDELIIAVGYKHMEKRAQLYDYFSDKTPIANIIHPSCIFSKSAKLGKGIVMFQGCSIGQNTIVKDNLLFYDGTIIAHDCIIESHSILSPRVTISGFCKVDEKCNLGTGSILIDNITLCKNVRSGAGTVFIKNINSEGLYIGCPGKILQK